MAFIKQRILKVLSVVVIIVVGFIGMNLLGSTEKDTNKRVIEPEIRTVNVEELEFGSYTLEVDGNGVVSPQKTLNFISEATGKVLFAKNDLKSGTYVQKGEKIVELDSREIENNLYSLRSDFMNSLASVIPDFKVQSQDIYDKWYDYFKNLDIHQEIPVLPEMTNSQEKIMVSSRNIFKKYYDVKNQEILLSKYEIRAPFEGFIESTGIIENSFITRGQQLFTLKDAKNLEISVPLLVEEANMLNFSAQPTVKIYSDNSEKTINGRIVRRETNLERNSQTMNVYVTFVNDNLDPNFLPGNYLNVAISGRTLSNVASIPRHLIRDNNAIYTMEEGKLAEEFVDIIAYQADRAIIKNSFPVDTRLVTSILQKPLIGMEIKAAQDNLPNKIDTNSSGESIVSSN
jgi:multidrug efflux pump subunit AcrA (membrane-fusion protein)